MAFEGPVYYAYRTTGFAPFIFGLNTEKHTFYMKYVGLNMLPHLLLVLATMNVYWLSQAIGLGIQKLREGSSGYTSTWEGEEKNKVLKKEL